MKRSASNVFPKVLFSIMEDAVSADFEHIIGWHSNGRMFKIHDRQAFVDSVCPKYGIILSSYKSFSRQLNLWGFACLHGGRSNPNKGYYHNSNFVRGCPGMLHGFVRTEIKGKKASKKQFKDSKITQKKETQQQIIPERQLNNLDLAEFDVIDESLTTTSCEEETTINEYFTPITVQDNSDDDDCNNDYSSESDASLVDLLENIEPHQINDIATAAAEPFLGPLDAATGDEIDDDTVRCNALQFQQHDDASALYSSSCHDMPSVHYDPSSASSFADFQWFANEEDYRNDGHSHNQCYDSIQNGLELVAY